MSNESTNPEDFTRSPWLPCMPAAPAASESPTAPSLSSALTNALFVALHSRDERRRSMSELLPTCLHVLPTFPGA